MSTAPLLRLVGVTVRFGKQTVLSNVHINVYPGETLALIGESGCGKSVTLKLIVGLLKPNEGDVYFEGRKLRDLNETELNAMRLRVGFLFQGAALFDSLNVFDNVAFGVRAKGGRSESEIQSRVFEHLQEVGLSANVARKMPVELSGGMRKRVGLARAMALQPDVMLYDEPTTGLDPIMTDIINELILRTHINHPVTSVVVTHEMRTVQKVADRVVMLSPHTRLAPGESQVLYDGTAAGLLQAADPRVPQFVLGEARDRMNELKAEHSRM